MTFEIEVNGRVRTISVERAGTQCGRFRVIVDGVPELVDAQRFGAFGVSLLFVDAQRQSGVVHLAPAAAGGGSLALLDGVTVPVAVNGRRTGHGAADAGAGAHGEQKVSAPMPGRVVRVLVAPGDEVAAKQPVVVIEAMKMENELRSPRAGRVRDVTVVPGASVEAGRVLVIVE